jgi:hypothetical protein
MGALPILDSWEALEAAWAVTTANPHFFVVDDMWNEWSRWNRVEADPSLVNASLLSKLADMVSAFPGWCVYFALEQGGLTIFENRILYEGFYSAGHSPSKYWKGAASR